MAQSLSVVYVFGAYELDTEARELRKSGLRRHVQPQVFRVLAYLVRSGGRVVTRSELRSLLWGECSVVEFDQGLNFAIHRIRIALDDPARSPRFIETLPKVGYRFLAPVVERRLEEDPSPSSGTAKTARSRSRRPAWLLVAACCVFDLGHVLPKAPGPPREPEAARAMLQRGFGEAEGGVSGRRRSIPLFREAQRLDPRLAEAHYAIAETYLELAREGGLSAPPALMEAREEADRAIAIEDRAETRLVRGWARFHLEGNARAARSDFERAVSIAPDQASILAASATFHSLAGSEADALELMARAEARSPACDLIAHDAARVFYRSRRFEAAIERFARAEELGTPRGLSRAQWQARNREGAMWARFAMSGEAVPDITRLLEAQGVPAAKIRRFIAAGPDPTRRFLESSLRRLEGQPGSTLGLIRLHAALGHRSEAMRYLSLAAASPSLDLLDLLASPAVDSLRSDPGFPGLRSMAFGSRPQLASRTLVAALAPPSGAAPN